MSFSDTLDILLEDQRCQWQPLESAMDIIRRLDSLKQQMLELQNDLMSLRNKMKGELAFNVKKIIPALNINLNQDEACKVGLGGKHLELDPNIDDGVWEVGASNDDISSQFISQHGPTLKMASDISPLVYAIGSFFAPQLAEHKYNGGNVVIEGKMGSLKDLVAWRDGLVQIRRRLPSRLGR